MGAVLVFDLQSLSTCEQFALAERQTGGRIIENVVPALLCFEQNGERRIALDIDAIDGIHLDGNAKGHFGLSKHNSDARRLDDLEPSRNDAGSNRLEAIGLMANMPQSAAV
jgi:hypothetical protein